VLSNLLNYLNSFKANIDSDLVQGIKPDLQRLRYGAYLALINNEGATSGASGGGTGGGTTITPAIPIFISPETIVLSETIPSVLTVPSDATWAIARVESSLILRDRAYQAIGFLLP
jgi:hypothetical protein